MIGKMRASFAFIISRIRWLLAAGGLLSAGVACAADFAVSAELSQSSTGVGEPVQLHVKVSGAHSAGQPPDVAVDGLRIDYLGPSQNTPIRIENGSFANESA